MGSSGVSQTERDIDGECGNCGYSGDAEEYLDPENYTSGWACPGCGDWHETDSFDAMAEGDPDDARDREQEDA